jgi:hypothetical protein
MQECIFVDFVKKNTRRFEMSTSRWIVAVVLMAVVALGAADLALAGKKAKGKDLYKEFCKPCHDKDSPNGEYTPMSLIQDQWERFFDKKFVASHKDLIDEKHEGKKVTDAISEENLKKIKKFAIDHAADSEQPMTCG